MVDDLGWIDAVGQAELVRSKEVSPLELVDAAIARIERLDPYLNAVIHRMYDKARAAAESGALPDGPFRGVPFLMKDAVAHTAGDPFHCGMAFLKAREHTEEADSYFAAKLRAAGFVFVGKTNLPELAASFLTEPVAYGPTHNPWDLARSTGGSSGGSAAAVAVGHGARGARERHGRLDPGAGERMRPRRAEAEPRPHVARPELRRVLGDAHPRARRDADRARLRGDPRLHCGGDAGRSLHRAAAEPPVRGRGRCRSRPLAHRVANGDAGRRCARR